MNNKEVIVSLAVAGENIKIGRLWSHLRKGRESATFEYERSWLNYPEKFAIEPAFKLITGSFHTKAGFKLFGAIGDSAPDRWGRILMRRMQAATLCEIDYLLGVNDEARQGALRFSLSANEKEFLAIKSKMSIPPLVYLPKLLSATERFIEHDENLADLKLLLAPGSSLGGARPKACVRDQDGSLAIAKFPKKDDDFNVVLWEAVALTLAKNAKINVPKWRIEVVLEKPVLIIKRFDREGNNYRVPFLSAMSMLEARDNEQHSYLEIAYALVQYGAEPTKDLEELWRRIVFSIMIANTDDHLRNHGFIFERYRGWRLSPVYDINPTPVDIKSRVLTTAIDFDNTAASLEIALNVANEFKLSKKRAYEIIEEVKLSVRQWQQIACGFGLSKVECKQMASAFIG